MYGFGRRLPDSELAEPVSRGRPPLLIGVVPARQRGEILLQPRGAIPQPILPRARHRRRRLPPLAVKLALALKQPAIATLHARDDLLRIKLTLGRPLLVALRPALAAVLVLLVALALGLASGGQLTRQPRPPPLIRLQLLGQLIPARLAVLLILGLIGRDRDLDQLLGDLPEINARLARRVTAQLRAIQRDHPTLNQPRTVTQLQHLAKQPRQRNLVTTHKPRHRRVIRHPIGGDHPIGDILAAVALDPARRVLTRRIRIRQQRQPIIPGSYAARPWPSGRYAS